MLSHGQAGLERGFSVNIKVLDKNMRELSLVLQPMVYDHVANIDVKIHEFIAPKVLMKEVKLAYQWYMQHLEKLKAIEESKEADKRTDLSTNKQLKSNVRSKM